jgi:periplasmic copper chaperone A
MPYRKIAAGGALVAALAAAPAQAHVTLQPETAPAGGFTRLDVRVPNERDEKGTTKVQVQFPPGFASVSTEPKPGWRMTVATRKAKEPIEQFGETVTEEVDTVTFTARKGTRVAPGEFVDFGLSLATPDEPGTTLTFKALQTYEGGEVVRWIGPADAEEPAPRVRLVAAAEDAAGQGGGDDRAAAAGAADAQDGEGEDEGASTGLVVAALILGALGLVAGVAGLLAARRPRAGTA